MPTYQILSERKSKYVAKISSPKDALPVLDRYRKSNRENFICISLNGAHEVISTRIISIGLVNRTIIHPREIFADAITDRATAILIAHNHPSGNSDPSPEDDEITKRIKDAGTLLGIELLDHIILGKGASYFSYLESGKMQ
jgi:DNA repair protein RadC